MPYLADLIIHSVLTNSENQLKYLKIQIQHKLNRQNKYFKLSYSGQVLNKIEYRIKKVFVFKIYNEHSYVS